MKKVYNNRGSLTLLEGQKRFKLKTHQVDNSLIELVILSIKYYWKWNIRVYMYDNNIGIQQVLIQRSKYEPHLPLLNVYLPVSETKL